MKKQLEISEMNNTYTPEYCDSLSLAYGDDMMSEGGAKEIDLILEGVDVRGKDVLDFGCGLGGLAFYLAKSYNSKVTGIEINPSTVAIAQNNTPEDIAHQVSFVLGDGETLPFADEEFDVIISKGVIVHLDQCQFNNTFQEFNRVLRKNGTLVIIDLLTPVQGMWSDEVKGLMETESLILHARTPSEYTSFLKTIFTNVDFQNRSEICAGYYDGIISRLSSDPIQSEFIKKYGEETLEDHLKGYKNLAVALQNGAVIVAKFVATKKS